MVAGDVFTIPSTYVVNPVEPKARMVTIRTPRGFVPRVDPITRQATSDPQQFRAVADERGHKLVIAPKSEWVSDPLVMDVDTIDYR